MRPPTTQNISPRDEAERREEWERAQAEKHAAASAAGTPIPYTPRTGETIRREHAVGGGYVEGATVYVPGADEDRADLPPVESLNAIRYGATLGAERAQSGGLEDTADPDPPRGEGVEGAGPFKNLRDGRGG